MDTTNTTARDVFMYLLVVITLAMSAVNVGTLLFQYVNLYVPDMTTPVCIGTWCQSAIRWSVASLIVVFPVLLWAWKFLQRDISAHPEKANSRVRRWLLYLTLFVAGGVLIGDAVSLIFNWLQGELTIQFLLKVLIVLYVAGTVFYYFLRALDPKRPGYARLVGRIAVGVVAASLVTGFIASGSPFAVRDQRIDEQRVAHLQELQSYLVSSYWQSKGELPTTLDELRDPVSAFMPPVDPQTKEPYEYARTGARSFKLCATFATASEGTIANYRYPSDAMNASWAHPAGKTCFDRTIDPELYPVRQPVPVK
ncbi:MAG: hypothetical protein IT406_00095 [Candidatus Yanofskybacteria bacterium]|nr:hypothetical protein [Candidatus Yanofskybacteria bacterium]